jgi:surfeit locus 1 family protein
MRRWLSARALGLGALAVVLMAGMGSLGLWQLGAYDQHQSEAARSRLQQPPVPLDRVLGKDAGFPADGVGRPVTVTGRYLPAEQIYVRGLAGSSAVYAVTTPLLTRAGSAILVVRGSSHELGPAPPQGQVRVTGVLEPSSDLGDPLGADRVTSGLRIAGLLDAFSADLYAGYIVLTASEPPDRLSPVNVALPEPSRLAGIRNLLYAVQWWVFAAFVAFMWWRIVLDLEERQTSDEPSDPRPADTISTTGVG